MEIKEALERAQQEIQTLRRQNELFAAKVDMIDLFAATLFGSPARGNGGMMTLDIVWEIGKLLEKIKEDAENDKDRSATITPEIRRQREADRGWVDLAADRGHPPERAPGSD